MSVFAAIHNLLDYISRVAVWVAGGALLLCAIMVTVDVIFRKFFGLTMSGSDEVTGYVFAAGTTWAYSYALIHRNNVRIDALYNVLPLWLRALLDVVALALLLLFMGVLTTQAYTVFETSWIQNSRSVTTLALPLWLPQLLWFAGLALFVFTLSFLLLYAVVLLLRGDLAQLQRIAGTLSVQEEVEESTQGIRELEGRSPTPPSARPDQER